jgi:predicted nucleotidyltransferase
MRQSSAETLEDAGLVVSGFVSRVTRRFEDLISRVIFFGSRSRGQARPDSDYDLLLVVRDKDRELVDQLYDEVVEFLLTYGVDLSLKIYTERDYQTGLTRGNPFICSVTRAGVELWKARRPS